MWCADCSLSIFLDPYSFLALCDYCTNNRIFGDLVFVVYMLVLFTEILYVVFLYAVHIFSFVCDMYYPYRVFYCAMCMVCFQYVVDLV